MNQSTVLYKVLADIIDEVPRSAIFDVFRRRETFEARSVQVEHVTGPS